MAGDGEEICVKGFHVDHTKGEHLGTTGYRTTQSVKSDNQFNCMKAGWLRIPSKDDGKELGHDSVFGVVFSPGKGIVIHKELYDSLSESVKSPVTPWAGGNQFHMGTPLNPIRRLNIIGETVFPFALREWHNWGYYIHFNVNALVTDSELPVIEPNSSLKERALAWIGIDLEEPRQGGSLVQLAYRAGGKGSKPLYWVKIKAGPLAGRNEAV
jgi:hypothetical protein